MRRIHFFLTAVCLLFLACKPEEVVKPSPPADTFVFGGEGREVGFDLTELPDGNILLVGSAKKPKNEDYDLQLVTISPSGEEIITRDFRSPEFDESGNAILPISTGYLVVGFQIGPRNQNTQIKVWLLDQDFNISSEHLLPAAGYSGTKQINSVYALANGGYAIAYSSQSDMNIVLVDADINVSDTKSFAGRFWDADTKFMTPVAGGFMTANILENYSSGGSGAQIAVTFFDENGLEQWAASSGFNGNSYNQNVNGFASLSDGSLVASVSQDAGDGLLVRLDSAGGLISSTSLQTASMINLIRELPSGNLLLGGNTLPSIYQYPGSTPNNVVLMEIDKNNTVLWTETFGGRENDSANNMLVSSTGSYILAGTSLSYGLGEADNFVVIYNR